jgi:hypothetical protein
MLTLLSHQHLASEHQHTVPVLHEDNLALDHHGLHAGGCTGIWQPYDMGIQQPFKLVIKRAQVDNVVAETTTFIESSRNPLEFWLNTTLGTLCQCSVQ